MPAFRAGQYSRNICLNYKRQCSWSVTGCSHRDIIALLQLERSSAMVHMLITFVSVPFVRIYKYWGLNKTLQWGHNERDGVSNHRRLLCLLNCFFFRHRSQRTPKLHVTGLCEGNSPVTGEFPAQGASDTKNVSSWWRHHDGARLNNLYRFRSYVYTYTSTTWPPRETTVISIFQFGPIYTVQERYINLNHHKSPSTRPFQWRIQVNGCKHQSCTLLSLCAGTPISTDGFPSQKTNNAESLSRSWRHHEANPFGVNSRTKSEIELKKDRLT